MPCGSKLGVEMDKKETQCATDFLKRYNNTEESVSTMLKILVSAR